MDTDLNEARKAAQSMITEFGGIEAIPPNIQVLVRHVMAEAEASDKHGLKTPAGLDHHFFIDKLAGFLRDTYDRFQMSNSRSPSERNERWACVARRAWEEIARNRPERIRQLLDNLFMVTRRVSMDGADRALISLDEDHIAELSKAYPGLPYPHPMSTLIQKLLNEAWLTIDGAAAQKASQPEVQPEETVPLVMYDASGKGVEVGRIPRRVWKMIDQPSGFSIGGIVDRDLKPENVESEEPELLVLMEQRLAAWLEREAPRVRDETAHASIKFTIMEPQWEDDDTLYLSFRAEEESIIEDNGGRVPGVKGNRR